MLDLIDTQRLPLERGGGPWMSHLTAYGANYDAFLLTVTERYHFPPTLTTSRRDEWARAHVTRGGALHAALDRYPYISGLDALAREGLEYEASVDIAHGYLAEWQGRAVANYERDATDDARERNEARAQASLDRFDGSLQLSGLSYDGAISVTHDEGSLSSID